MAKCSGCKIVDTVHLTLADLGSGAAQQKVATALQSNPSATYLDSPFDSAIPAFIAGAIKDSGRKNLQIMGDECFPINLSTSARAARRVRAARWPRTGTSGQPSTT